MNVCFYCEMSWLCMTNRSDGVPNSQSFTIKLNIHSNFFFQIENQCAQCVYAGCLRHNISSDSDTLLCLMPILVKQNEQIKLNTEMPDHHINLICLCDWKWKENIFLNRVNVLSQGQCSVILLYYIYIIININMHFFWIPKS